MATPSTLADVLIEAGFEPEMARRATEAIEQDLTALARQAEIDTRFDKVDDRFDKMDDRFEAQGRWFETRLNSFEKENNARFDGVDKEIKAVNTRISDLRAEFVGRFQDLKESMERSFTEHKESVAKEFKAVHQRIDDLKESVDRRFTILTWTMIFGFGGVFAVLGYIISRLP